MLSKSSPMYFAEARRAEEVTAALTEPSGHAQVTLLQTKEAVSVTSVVTRGTSQSESWSDLLAHRSQRGARVPLFVHPLVRLHVALNTKQVKRRQRRDSINSFRGNPTHLIALPVVHAAIAASDSRLVVTDLTRL